jgi:glucose/arabinose dehydrogenase
MSPGETPPPLPTPTEPAPSQTAPAIPTNTSLPAAATPTIPPTTGLPDPAAYAWTLFSSGLENPVGLTHAGDDSGRLFILEQSGRIRIIQDGDLLPQPFLDITPQVNCCGERGLLGLAFHPQFAANGFFFINYTALSPVSSPFIARFQVSADPNQADATNGTPAGGRPAIPQSQRRRIGVWTGWLFYIGLGDGGAAGDPHGNGQALDTPLGKILRLDVDRGDPYAIPSDNPFATGG